MKKEERKKEVYIAIITPSKKETLALTPGIIEVILRAYTILNV
jgi:hypothetical protein